ncbi:MAG: helix-turn-helix domain-containing protein, partial [Desulfobacterales bacterium]|nr:helix-turn-helix domain-containing protein [Desulfobacterales bacterium]
PGGGRIMIEKKLLQPNRVRHIDGGFSFIPHRFLTDGFLASLNQMEILLYLFLVLVSDRYGLSFYSYDAICSFLQITLDQYIEARDSLIRKDLIASDGTLFQVLDLPKQPVEDPVIKQYRRHIKTTIQQSLWGN